MKQGKVIDKTKGPVKTAAPSVVSKKTAAAKARKMGREVKVKAAALPPCSLGHPVIWVHYNYLSTMRKWCGTCQQVQG